MLFKLFLLVVLTSPFVTSVDEHVDQIELAHLFDEKGAPVYDQVIFYRDNKPTCKLHVRTWTLLEPGRTEKLPVETPHNNQWHVRWFDKDARIYRHITSSQYKETWRQVDSERENKDILHESRRVSLIRKADVPTVNPIVEPEPQEEE